MQSTSRTTLARRFSPSRRGAVTIENVLLLAAIALPIIIFSLKIAWPQIRATTTSNLTRQQPKDLAEARLGVPLIAFSDELRDAQREMKRFLHQHLYQHFQVLRMTSKARRIINDLYLAFVSDPRMLPLQYQSEGDQPRRVADYIAGMTDRYAMKEHRRLFAVGEF